MAQHRIFLAPYRPDRPPSAVQRYWRNVHAAVFSTTPHLVAYRQNRPVETEWDRLGYVCSETWFTDRQAEQDGFGSEYYATAVTEDERRFTDRDSAWHARVVGDAGPASVPARYRVLGFGSNPARLDGRAELVELDRPTPNGGPPHVLSLWTDDLADAQAAAARLDGVAFVAEPSNAEPAPTDVLNSHVFRLSFAHCDPAGIIYFATYFPFFERVHTEWGWRAGVPSDQLPELWGVSVVARASTCEYFNAPVLHDELRCEERLGRLGSSSYTMAFDVVRTADELTMARGTMTLVCVGADGRPAPVPTSLAAVLSSPRT
jgi:YbgC/YbaW family acyl-CoA thioester hydrolase